MLCSFLPSCGENQIINGDDTSSAYKQDEGEEQIITTDMLEEDAELALADKKGRRSATVLSEALAWSNVTGEFKTRYQHITFQFGKTIEEMVYYGIYAWFPGDMEALLIDEDSLFRFSAPFFSEGSRCVASNYDPLYLALNTGGIFTLGEAFNSGGVFSLEEVVGAGGDVSWVDGTEAYLSYKFDGLELRIYTNESGDELVKGQWFFIKGLAASDEMYGMDKIDRNDAFISPSVREAKKWGKFNRYLSLIGKTESDILEMLGDAFSHVNTYDSGTRSIIDNDGTQFLVSEEDGRCYTVRYLPVEVCFEDIDRELEDLEMMKWFDVPFAFPVVEHCRIISFDDAVIYFYQDKNGSFADGTIEIFGEEYAHNYTPGDLF
jgi:hypothetical protein